MSAAVRVTRTELTAATLRRAAGRSRDAKAARRMPGIALVLEGVDRTTAAETRGMDRRTLRDWVHRYNAEGLAGLVNRSRGAPRDTRCQWTYVFGAVCPARGRRRASSCPSPTLRR